jgi:hypothetical protein
MRPIRVAQYLPAGHHQKHGMYSLSSLIPGRICIRQFGTARQRQPGDGTALGRGTRTFLTMRGRNRGWRFQLAGWSLQA